MIKQKRLVKLLGAIIATFTLFTGCTSNIDNIRAETADEAMNLFNKYNEEGNISNMVSLYSDVYLDSTGYSAKQITKILKGSRDKADVTKSVVESIKDIDENSKLAKVKITATIEGKEQTDTYNYALVKEQGGWAVSPDGITKCVNFDVPAPKDNELNLNLSKVITTFDGVLVRISVNNNSKDLFMFGGEGNKCEVVVETTEGIFNTFMDEEVKLDKNAKTYFIANIEGLVGDVNKVTLKSIYDVDPQGNVVPGSANNIIVYEK